MKEYTLTVGNRRPLRFKGDLIASTIDHEAFTEQLVDGKNTIVDLLSDGYLPKLLDRVNCYIAEISPDSWGLTLTLFKTEGGNYVYLMNASAERGYLSLGAMSMQAAECVEPNQKTKMVPLDSCRLNCSTLQSRIAEDPELTVLGFNLSTKVSAQCSDCQAGVLLSLHLWDPIINERSSKTFLCNFR